MNIKQELVQYYHWLRQYGLNDSHSGNISVRDGNKIWVTPTGACADTLTDNDLIDCTLTESPPVGATLDAALHLAVYQQNKNANAVMHSHGAHTVAMTLNGDDFIPADFEGQYYFPAVPVLNIAYDDYLDEAPQRVAKALSKHKIVIVRGHGIYAQAETLNLAYKWTCSLELSAKTACLAKQVGTL